MVLGLQSGTKTDTNGGQDSGETSVGNLGDPERPSLLVNAIAQKKKKRKHNNNEKKKKKQTLQEEEEEEAEEARETVNDIATWTDKAAILASRQANAKTCQLQRHTNHWWIFPRAYQHCRT